MKQITLKEELRQALTALARELGTPVYLVGGCVRNALLGLPAADVDIASAALPEQVLAAAARMGVQAAVVHQTLGTVELYLAGERIEHTAFRRESYAPGGGHAPRSVQLGASLKEDALRRDFSVNALYYDVAADFVLDPTGRGFADLEKRRLRSARPKAEEMIRDDALRLLRMVRFACQLGFTIQKELFLQARRYAHQIAALPRERIAPELTKILLSDTAYDIPQSVPPQKRGLLYLKALGLLQILIPEFARADEMGKCQYHRYSVLMHSICSCAAAPPDLVTRLAALLHDIGKPSAWLEQGNMHGHDAIGAPMAEERLKALGFSHKIAGQVRELVAAHMFDLDGKTREVRVRRQVQRMGYEAFYRLADLREADAVGTGKARPPILIAEYFRETAGKMKAEGIPMSPADLAISGKDLQALGLKGPQIGQVLQKLVELCAADPGQNTPKRLLAQARGLAQNAGE